MGIQHLPVDLEAALGHFAADQVLQEAMKPAFAIVFSAVRRAELESLAELTFDEERQLLLQHY